MKKKVSLNEEEFKELLMEHYKIGRKDGLIGVLLGIIVFLAVVIPILVSKCICI